MKQLFLIFILTFVILTTIACNHIVRGSGNHMTETRNVSDFAHIDLKGSGDVTVIQGDELSVVVETDDNIMPYISTEVSGDTLHLGTKNGAINLSYTKLHFTITVVDLDGLHIAGSGNINTAAFSTADLDISINGSGDIAIDQLTADTLTAAIRGSGDIDVAGEVESQTVRINGSGNYASKHLQSETAEVNIRGSGDISVWAADELDITIAGSGDVRYYGSPSLTFADYGSGDVSQIASR